MLHAAERRHQRAPTIHPSIHPSIVPVLVPRVHRDCSPVLPGIRRGYDGVHACETEGGSRNRIDHR